MNALHRERWRQRRKMIGTHSKPTGPLTELLNTMTLLIPKLSLLFFLALDGSVDHEVGEVDVALGFLRLWQSAASVTGACKKTKKNKNKPATSLPDSDTRRISHSCHFFCFPAPVTVTVLVNGAQSVW